MSVAKVYAKALYELSSEKREATKMFEALSAFSHYLEKNKNVEAAINGQMFPVSERRALLKELAEKTEMDTLLSRFLETLVVKNRISFIHEILKIFREMLDESEGTVRGTVTTAELLSDTEREDLCKAFGKKLNKKVILEPIQNKELLGGLVVQIRGLTFDGSLKTTIRRLKETLERQAV